MGFLFIGFKTCVTLELYVKLMMRSLIDFGKMLYEKYRFSVIMVRFNFSETAFAPSLKVRYDNYQYGHYR